MRTNLKVPFAEKDEAKKLGARWDATRKLWYVEDKEDMSPFARWMSAVSGYTIGNRHFHILTSDLNQGSVVKSHKITYHPHHAENFTLCVNP